MFKKWILRLSIILAAALILLAVCVYPYVRTYPVGKVGENESELRKYRHHGINEGEYELGAFFVLENRADPASRVIGINFARFKAESPGGSPIFLLPGGPGNSFIDKDNDLWLSKTPDYLEALRKHHDIVLVNQRGHNQRRNNSLIGSNVAPPGMTEKEAVEFAKREANKTAKAYAKRGVDLRGYSVLECVEDVDELRMAFGYDKIILMGQSFGSQWSFAFIRQHPEFVERAILSGVEPLDHTYDMPSHVLAAAQRVWKSVDDDPRFASYLPAGGMIEVAETVASRLESNPLESLCLDDFPYNDPVALLEIYHGHTGRWDRKVHRAGRYGLIYQLFDTSLGITPKRREVLEGDSARRYVPLKNAAQLMATADIWPNSDVGDDFRNPVSCEVPVVFVHGNWDMNTPIENTYEISPFFPNGHVIEVHRGGHNPIPPMVGQHPDVFAALLKFAHTGSTNDLPHTIEFAPSKTFNPPTFNVSQNGK